MTHPYRTETLPEITLEACRARFLEDATRTSLSALPSGDLVGIARGCMANLRTNAAELKPGQWLVSATGDPTRYADLDPALRPALADPMMRVADDRYLAAFLTSGQVRAPLRITSEEGAMFVTIVPGGMLVEFLDHAPRPHSAADPDLRVAIASRLRIYLCEDASAHQDLRAFSALDPIVRHRVSRTIDDIGLRHGETLSPDIFARLRTRTLRLAAPPR